MSIESLPDYPLLKKLAEALWRNETSYQGAAIMVGSGFSRSAASSSDINSKLPLWNDLLKVLSKDLESDPWADPLRIAEEYSSYFGKQALKDVIEQTVNDPAWIPGDLYDSLLKLPWAEVLTTNWDTLLERAASDIYKPIYSIVNKPEDLSSSRSPRIVKLHGTVQISHNLIFTQEDYRQYPKTHAAFVNLARQIFIENEFCLLGFSGDDPNFLQWVGWVRDHLASHARRIYLVGALDLSPAKRKYLESINVAPIDLSSLVEIFDNHDEKHREATKLFLKALHDLKPKNSWDWEPISIDIDLSVFSDEKQSSEEAIKSINTIVEHLKLERETYPEWLVCPRHIRCYIQQQINFLSRLLYLIATIDLNKQENLLYEIAWRYGVIYQLIPIQLANKLLKICTSHENTKLDKVKQFEIALVLLKSSRWSEDESFEKIQTEAKKILQEASKYSKIFSNELHYFEIIVARDKFDYLSMMNLTKKIIEYNSTWEIRKSSLSAELGQLKDAENLLKKAYKELKMHSRNQPNSVYILSRLAWANYLLNGVSLLNEDDLERIPYDFSSSYSNPWEYLKEIDESLTGFLDNQRKQKTIELRYNPGTYKDNSSTIKLHNGPHPLLLLEGLANSVGLPIRWGICDFIAGSTAKLAEMDSIDTVQRFSLAIRSAHSSSSSVLETVFSRIAVATLNQSVIDQLLKSCINASNFWSDELSLNNTDHSYYCIGRLAVFLEVVARLSVRVEVDKAKDLFLWVCKLIKIPELRDPGLIEVYSHLIQYTLSAIPENDHNQLLIEALHFPLPQELKKIHYQNNFPNPVIKNLLLRPNNNNLDHRVYEIINSISSDDEKSMESILRLLPLFEANFLTIEETKLFEQKLWNKSPEYEKIPEVGLLPFMLLRLPYSDKRKIKALISDYHFDKLDNIDTERLISIANAAVDKKVLLFPSETQALELFNKITNWQFTIDVDEVSPFYEHYTKRAEKEKLQWAGYALSQSITESLNKSELNYSNFNKLLEFYSRTNSYETLSSFIYFIAEDQKYALLIEKMIRKSLYTDSIRQTASSIAAVIKWCELDYTEQAKELVTRLLYQINPNRTVGLHILLNAARYLCIHKFLSTRNIESLIEIIPIVFDSTDYINISPSSTQAISFTLVRSACVKLAKEIFKDISITDHELKRIIDEAKTDPLPEVRFA